LRSRLGAEANPLEKLKREKHEKNQIRRDVAGSFFVWRLIVTFERLFITGVEKEKGRGDRMGIA